MTDRELFPNAPITEAIFNISADGVVLDENHLNLIADKLSPDFPNVKNIVQFQQSVELRPDGSAPVVTSSNGSTQGRAFQSSDGRQVIQCRVDGFSYHLLKPYSDWDSFKNTAQDMWNMYRSICRPTRITRLGLRYVNKLDLPLPFSDFKEYILTVPEVAPNVPQLLSRLFMRLEIPEFENELLSVVTVAMEPPTEPTFCSIIFDIDTIKLLEVNPDNPAVWRSFEDLRDLKNRIFFNSLTEKARGLFR